jgi:hypothetical protein
VDTLVGRSDLSHAWLDYVDLTVDGGYGQVGIVGGGSTLCQCLCPCSSLWSCLFLRPMLFRGCMLGVVDGICAHVGAHCWTEMFVCVALSPLVVIFANVDASLGLLAWRARLAA